MKLQVLQEQFASSLTVANRFTSSRSQLPILGNLYFSASKNKLLISGTNLEMSIVHFLGAKVEKEGEITIPAKVISELVSDLPKGTLNLESEKEKLSISTPNFTSVISGMNVSDFPTVPRVISDPILIFDKKAVLETLTQLLFSVSNDETRPVLTGILFMFIPGSPKKGGEIVLVSTDGFRLSKKRLAVEEKLQKEKVIIPRNVLSELVRIAGETEKIKFSNFKKDNQVIFGLEQIILASRVIEGNFPDFEKIIPQSTGVKIKLDKEEFLRSVRLASVFARDSANVVKIGLGEADVRVSAESAQSGSQETIVDAKIENDTGQKDITIAFNFKFLEDILNVLKGDEIVIGLNDSDSPGVFTDPKDTDFLHLIMPVRMQS